MAGSPVSSATSSHQSTSSGGSKAVRGPHSATGSPGVAPGAHPEAGPSSSCRNTSTSSSCAPGRSARTV
ncbi:MAG TPA: hypothetical protein VFZ68_14630 [Acidimicrobiales bacterium]